MLAAIAVTIPSPFAIVNVSPRATASEEASLPVIVNVELASFSFVTLPFVIFAVVTEFDANSLSVIPLALTCKALELISIVVSSTLAEKQYQLMLMHQQKQHYKLLFQQFVKM